MNLVKNIVYRTFFVVFSVLAPATVVAPLLAIEIEAQESFESPRLAALAKELASEHPERLDKFWEELKGHAPIVEPIADRSAYFLGDVCMAR